MLKISWGLFFLLIVGLGVQNVVVGQEERSLHFSRDGLTVSRPRSGLNALDYTVEANGKVILRGKLGLALPDVTGVATETCDGGGADQCFEWGDFAQLKITSPREENGQCAQMEWFSSFGRRLEDCIQLEDGVHWYGGAETRVQTWPIEHVPRDEHAYVTGDFLTGFQFGGLVETYWLASSGVAIHVAEDTPLFTSWNTTHQNQFCIVAQDRPPYENRNQVQFKYEICVPKPGESFKDVHVRAMKKYYRRPTSIPDEQMIVNPFWSSWAQYRTSISQEKVLEMARRMVAEGYTNNSHIEIDDKWESCYGEAEFNEKFPDPAGMTKELAELGISRTTLWTHPYINSGCPSFSEALAKGYFIKDARSKPTITGWWAGSTSGAIDFTNKEAVNWWRGRLENLKSKYNISAFKFDGGEAMWLPPSMKLDGDSNLLPNLYSSKYVEAVAPFGGMIETRTASRNQNMTHFLRMLDKDSVWEDRSGLRSLIPTLLLFNVLGYSFVLPDMIGGFGYDERVRIDPEMYIRWAQINVFMPAWQFSVQPWNIDNSTVNVNQIIKSAVELRQRHGEKLLAAARQTVIDGTPMNPPLWWVDPEDPVTYTIDDQFMLGEDIMVAPVVYEGQITRNIYLPKGTWSVEVENGVQIFYGPRWLENWPAPLHVLPYFTKQK